MNSFAVWTAVKRSFCVYVCVCVCGMTVDHGVLLSFDGVPVRGHRSALFFVDLLPYVGWDSRVCCELRTMQCEV